MLKHILILTLLLLPVNGLAGKYNEAVDKAKEAAIKQSGVEFYIDNAKRFGEKELDRYLKEAGLGEVAGPVGYIAKSMYYRKLVLKYKAFGIEVTEGRTAATFTWKF